MGIRKPKIKSEIKERVRTREQAYDFGILFSDRRSSKKELPTDWAEYLSHTEKSWKRNKKVKKQYQKNYK